MADIDPYAQLAVTMSTPRSPTIVDQVAEARRIADATLRSNPLYNANVDGGLTVWKGNYAGQFPNDPVRDSIVWIGQFGPYDTSFTPAKQQRGFQVTRDDPRHAQAISVWDPNANGRDNGSNPARQRLFMQDADGRQIMSEASGGGLAYPLGQIPLYGTKFNYYSLRTDAGTTLKNVPCLPAYVVRDTATGMTYYEGYGSLTGHRLRIYGFGSSNASGPFQVRATVDFQDGSAIYTTSYITCASGGSQTFLWDIDFNGMDKIGKTIHIRIEANITSGSTEWAFLFMAHAYCLGN